MGKTQIARTPKLPTTLQEQLQLLSREKIHVRQVNAAVWALEQSWVTKRKQQLYTEDPAIRLPSEM